MEEAISGVSGIDEIQARIAEGRGQITVRFVLERDLNDAANDVREKVASAIRNVPPELLPPVITKVDPDADPVMSLIVSSDAMSLRTLTELADKQIARVDPDGQRRRRGQPRRRPRARDPHRRRHREAELVRPVDQRRCATPSSPRTSRSPAARSSRARASCCCARSAASTRPQDFNDIVVATKNGTPIRVSDIGYAEDSFERPTTRGVAGRHAGGHARHPPRDGREHGRGDRGRARQARDDRAVAARRR